jgi:hypothetical protein
MKNTMQHIARTLGIEVDWGFVVELAVPGKVTRRAYKVCGIFDRFLTKVCTVQS